MKADRLTKVVLWTIAVLLFLNLVYNLVSSRPAVAVAGDDNVGRYQIAAWASQSGGTASHIGYYILDTTTGKVVASKAGEYVPGQ